MSIDFLTVDDVLLVHADQIKRYGGDPAVRDVRLLESAVATAQVKFEGRYLHADIFEMAAAYLFHIVANHPFVDGNKRTGAASAIVFLDLNGREIVADEDSLYSLVMDVAQNRADKPRAADFFRRTPSA